MTAKQVLDVSDISLDTNEKRAGIAPQFRIVEMNPAEASEHRCLSPQVHRNVDRYCFSGLAGKRRRESDGDLDEIGLARGSSFLEYISEMGLDGGFRDTERDRYFRDTTDFHDREQHP
jgi:hypothetical protein